jgi:hypothetical protein
MAVERKLYQQEKVEKKKIEVEVKKVKRGFKTDQLPDAFVDGNFIAKVGSEIIVSRYRNGKDTLSICTVKEIEDSGLIHTWDETLQQWFVFPISQPPKLTKIKND